MKLKHITLLAAASLVLAACNNPQIPEQKEAQTPQKHFAIRCYFIIFAQNT